MYAKKPRKASYQGVPAEIWEIYPGARRSGMGERVSCILWPDGNPNTGAKPGDLVVSHIKGDGRTPKFIVFEKHTIKYGTPNDALSWAGRRLMP